MNLPKSFGWIGVDVWANQELNKRHSSRKHCNGGKQLGGFGEFDCEIVYGNSIGPVNLTVLQATGNAQTADRLIRAVCRRT